MRRNFAPYGNCGRCIVGAWCDAVFTRVHQSATCHAWKIQLYVDPKPYPDRLQSGPIAFAEKLFLRMENDDVELRSSWSTDGVAWNEVDHVFEATMLGDGVSPHSNFTGTF